MRIRRQPTAFGELGSEILQVMLVETPFEEGPGVNAGGGVALEIDQVAEKGVRAARGGNG